mmetsp:Transcript_166708/g.405129  ORF Transcript_166708/g.405129 Transcript_166708/m.405129 type:complete len:101 (+) Transcript_166708:179-481(+)
MALAYAQAAPKIVPAGGILYARMAPSLVEVRQLLELKSLDALKRKSGCVQTASRLKTCLHGIIDEISDDQGAEAAPPAPLRRAGDGRALRPSANFRQRPG